LHATRSLSNPYVKITIDLAAWGDDGPRGHSTDHHAREKHGYSWADLALEKAADECPAVVPPVDPPPTDLQWCTWTEKWVNYVITFDGTKFVTGEKDTTSATVDIPADTYDVVLVSSDPVRGGSAQDHEQWRLLGDTPSDYSTDLVDNGSPVINHVSPVSSVTFDSMLDTATAEHWSVENEPQSDADKWNSVVPVGACLTKAESKPV
jgi:hypothetical protein